jgi:hypothetical protein
MNNEKIKIAFLVSHENMSSGSYRIWVHDYNKYFREIGVDSRIIQLCKVNSVVVSQLRSIDAFIISKCLHNNILEVTKLIKTYNPSAIIGAITPPRDMPVGAIDFAMAGSLEEYDSLSFHRNVILNAHIESLYYESKIKQHKKVNTLKICYHGWTPHLFSFNFGVRPALELLAKTRDIELCIISELTKEQLSWTKDNGAPSIPITYKKWDIKTVKNNILECDVGICPGVYDMSNELSNIDNKKGKFSTDFTMRYKNKTNNGRALAFMCLGLPVIADFSPSNFHLFGDNQCGSVAHTAEGWYRSLNRFSCFKERSLVVHRAKEFINLNYNPYDWSGRYYNQILKIFHEKRNSNKIK